MAIDDDGVPQRVQLPTGELIWVRVQSPDGWPDDESDDTAQDVGGRHGRRKGRSVLDDNEQISKLIGFTETVGGIAHSVRNSVAAVRPNHVEVEFGLEIDASTGKVISLVASAHAKASIKVKLAWEHPVGGGAPGADTDGALPADVDDAPMMAVDPASPQLPAGPDPVEDPPSAVGVAREL
ncbi:MAG: CU044_2847 family protein [Catenulispora sp.]